MVLCYGALLFLSFVLLKIMYIYIINVFVPRTFVLLKEHFFIISYCCFEIKKKYCRIRRKEISRIYTTCVIKSLYMYV